MKRVIAVAIGIAVIAVIAWRLHGRGAHEAPAQTSPAPTARPVVVTPSRTRPASTVIAGTVSAPATVWLVGEHGGDEQSSTGSFEFAELEPGTYCVVAVGAAGTGSQCAIVVARGERKSIAIVLAAVAADVTLAGSIRDGGGGGIAGARIVARRQPLGDRMFATTSGADGTYKLGLPRGDYNIEVAAEGYAPLARFARLSADADESFALVPAATIAGIVVDANHQPVPGAEIRTRLDEYWDRGREKQLTGADGRFEIAGLPAGAFVVTARAPDGLIGEARGHIVLGARTEVEITVHPGVVVKGVVKWRDGGGVAGAIVETAGPYSHQTVTTAADGTFRVDGVGVGELPLTPRADGVEGEMKFVLVGPAGRDDVVLELDRMGTLDGRVITSVGAAVSDAEVRADPGGATRSDSSGRFTLAVPAGSTSVVALRDGLSKPVVVDVPAARSATLELVIGGDAAIEGTVKSPRGVAIANTKVTLTSRSSRVEWNAATDERGAFRFGPLPAGNYVIVASPRGASGDFVADGARAALLLAAGETAHANLVALVGDRTLAGRVTDADGAPVSGAEVWAERMASKTLREGSVRDATAYTLADGTFELFGIPDGTYVIGAYHVDHERVRSEPVPAGTRDARLQFRRPGVLAGTVKTVDGVPAPVFSLAWTFPDGEHFRASGYRVFTGGSFEITGLPPRNYDLEATTAAGESGQLAYVALAEGEQKRDLQLVVLAPGGIRGRLVDKASKQPVAGVDVGGQGSMTRTAPDGTFLLERVRSGTNQPLWVYARDGSSRDVNTRFDLTITAGKVTDIGDFEVTVD